MTAAADSREALAPGAAAGADLRSSSSSGDVEMHVFGAANAAARMPASKARDGGTGTKPSFFVRAWHYFTDTNRPLPADRVRQFALFLPTFRLYHLLWFVPFVIATGVVPILFYSLPLAPVESGFYDNWLFAFIVVPAVTFFGFLMVRPFLQTHRPDYRFSGHWVVGAGLGCCVSLMLSSLMGHMGIFPAPFGALSVVIPGVITTTVAEFFLLEKRFRATLPQMLDFATIVATEALLVNFHIIYFFYRLGSLRLDGVAQAAFAFLLPVLKFAFIQSMRPLIERVDRSLLPVISYFAELYHNFYYAVLFSDSPHVITVVVMVLADIVPWLLFLYRVHHSRSNRHWDEPEIVTSLADEAPATVASDAFLAPVTLPPPSHLTAFPPLVTAMAPAPSLQAVPMDEAPPAPLPSKKRYVSPAKAAAEVVVVEDMPALTPGMPAMAAANGSAEWTAARAAKVAADPEVMYAFAGVFGRRSKEPGGADAAVVDRALLAHLMQPRERRVLYVTAHAFTSFVLQAVVPMQFMVFLAVIRRFSDFSHFYILENLTEEGYQLALLYNGIHIAVHFLVACVTLPFIYARLRVNFLAYGTFFFQQYAVYFATAHSTVLTIIIGLTLKHFGDDFTFQFDWLHK